MTQEEKQLLLKAICGYLPYELIYHRNDGANIKLGEIDVVRWLFNYTDWPKEWDIKPYLRSMDSMTEDEENEYRAINCYEGLFPRNEDALDYVLSHRLDYRRLIEMNLALEAPEGMYMSKTK